MKYAIRLRNEKGKEVKLAADEYIDIDVMHGNKRIEALTLRDSKEHGVTLFIEDDENDTSTPLHH